MARRDTFITGTDLTENDAILLRKLDEVALDDGGPCYRGMLAELEKDGEDELIKLKRMVRNTRKNLDNHQAQLRGWQTDVDGLKKGMQVVDGGSHVRTRAIKDESDSADKYKRRSSRKPSLSSGLLPQEKAISKAVLAIADAKDEGSTVGMSQHAFLQARNFDIRPGRLSTMPRSLSSGNVFRASSNVILKNVPVSVTGGAWNTRNTTTSNTATIAGDGRNEVMNGGVVSEGRGKSSYLSLGRSSDDLNKKPVRLVPPKSHKNNCRWERLRAYF